MTPHHVGDVCIGDERRIVGRDGHREARHVVLQREIVAGRVRRPRQQRLASTR